LVTDFTAEGILLLSATVDWAFSEDTQKESDSNNKEWKVFFIKVNLVFEIRIAVARRVPILG